MQSLSSCCLCWLLLVAAALVVLPVSGKSPSPPTALTLGGPGQAGTYTLPTAPKPLYLRVRLVGAGGGGSASSNTDSALVSGTNGSATVFGPFSAGGGAGGQQLNLPRGGAPGIPVVGSFSGYYVGVSGAPGQGGTTLQASSISFVDVPGGAGGASQYGGSSYSTLGYSPAQTVFGAGGAGGCASVNSGNTNDLSIQSGAGGGSGAYIEAVIHSPAASYSYGVGTPGSGAKNQLPAADDCGGTNGGSGLLIIEQFYQ